MYLNWPRAVALSVFSASLAVIACFGGIEYRDVIYAGLGAIGMSLANVEKIIRGRRK